MENQVYKLINPENISYIRDIFANAQSLVINPKLFSAEDHKYLALGLLRNIHRNLLNLIESHDSSIAFLFEVNISNRPTRFSYCEHCNLIISDGDSEILICEVCKEKWHFNCVHEGNGKEHLDLVKDD